MLDVTVAEEGIGPGGVVFTVDVAHGLTPYTKRKTGFLKNLFLKL